MHHLAIYISTAIFILLGLWLGWSYRIRTLTAGAAIAALSALLFVPDGISHWTYKVAMVALLFWVAIESGFVMGLFSAKNEPLHARNGRRY